MFFGDFKLECSGCKHGRVTFSPKSVNTLRENTTKNIHTLGTIETFIYQQKNVEALQGNYRFFERQCVFLNKGVFMIENVRKQIRID